MTDDASVEGTSAETGEPPSDSELLRCYAEERSETAFAELVRRHLNFVYAAALRRVGGDTHLAEDIAQQVFAALARDATKLARRPVLAGWLYTTTRFASAHLVRTERRRQVREQEACIMNELSSPDPALSADWERLRPVLDDAMDLLDERDREAVLLRFFEGRSFADVGAKLRLTENAARMRVERALDKLHALLGRRGVTSTTAALAMALANQAGVAAPAGLAASVTGSVLASSAVTATTTAGLGLFAFMSTGKTALGLAGIAAVVTLGTAFSLAGRVREAETALDTAKAQQAAASAKLGELEKRVGAEMTRAQLAEAQNGRLLEAVQKQKQGIVVKVAEEEEFTSVAVSERFRRAQGMARSGDFETALRELLWCFDIGMKRAPNMSSSRRVNGTRALADLGERYSPARLALLERRENARQTMLQGADEDDATRDFAALNEVLRDGAMTIAALDLLPPGDPRRKSLASSAFADLVEARRYDVALEGRAYGVISATFEGLIAERSAPGQVVTDDGRRQRIQVVVDRTTLDIETLAGGGDLAHARSLANRLLAYDQSEATRKLLQERVARAGHPDLLKAPAQ